MTSPAHTVVLDLGANNGDFALDVATRNPGALVVAVEPVEALATAIRARVDAAGLTNVVVVQFAVAGERGNATLNLSTEGDRGVTSLLDFDDTVIRADEYWATRADLTFSGAEEVEVVTLEDLLREQGHDGVAFAKIDVQGKDLEALLSAGPLLPGVRAGMLECSTTDRTRLYRGEPTLREVLTTLEQHGFDVYAIKPNDPALNEVNVYFIRRGEDPVALEAELSLRGVHLYDGKHFWGVPASSAEGLEAALAGVAGVERLREIEERNAVVEARVQAVEADLVATKAAYSAAVADLTELRRHTFQERTQQSVAVSRLKSAMEQATTRLDAARRERDESQAELDSLRSSLATQPRRAAGVSGRLPERVRPVARRVAGPSRSAVRRARALARRLAR